MTILIDNYDSFTYNLVQYFGDLGISCDVYRNDKISITDVIAQTPREIIISPGPATPDEAGICLDLILSAAKHHIPVLGICLGHQAIGQAFGGRVIRAPQPVHGKTWHVEHNGADLFADIPSPAEFTRYHSLIVEQESLPDDLNVIATSADDDLIMALKHKHHPIYGVQFHPESIASTHGKQILKNFIQSTRKRGI